MEKQKIEQEQRKILLRMSNRHYDIVKSESQRMNISVTAMLNFIISDFVKRLKLNDDSK